MTNRQEASRVTLQSRGPLSLGWRAYSCFLQKRKSLLNLHAERPSPRRRNLRLLVAIEGHISCDGELHIDGTVRGTVQANLCVIDEAGVVQGTVNGQVVHVRGRILGPIQGANVFIHAGAHVEGDVFNDTISIENGAYVFGSIRHNTAPPPAPAQPSLLNGAGSGDLSPDTANKLRVISNRK
jgi:cytoskeletal protein CcmA (bactofilin family)